MSTDELYATAWPFQFIDEVFSYKEQAQTSIDTHNRKKDNIVNCLLHYFHRCGFYYNIILSNSNMWILYHVNITFVWVLTDMYSGMYL